MDRPRDIVANRTVVEVVYGPYAGMRGYLRDLNYTCDAGTQATVELVGRNEPIRAEMRVDYIRPAKNQSIGTGEG